MVVQKDRETIVIKREDAPDVRITREDYLETLDSPVRLAILELLFKEDMDVQTLSHNLHSQFSGGGRENTEKHLKKLMDVGFVIPQTEVKRKRDNRNVTNNKFFPGSYENAR